MNTVIKVEDLSKQYRLGQVGTGSIMHDINRSWHKVRGKEDPYLKIGEINDRTVKSNSDYVWALKDINFDVQQGDVVGIIGRNGAGKSTLLKILSRTTTPTTGSIKIKGRIASLLEVGTGFHPELSGRDNIFLNGAILGMSRNEIKRKFDEIVDFAGVERYIDTPVKRYSSGMYVRLAFGVAAHLEPEILIVDEVLAVGDIEFQKKALGKMKDVSTNDGRTVLFVSHNMASMQALCTKGLLMQNGTLASSGSMPAVIKEYEQEYQGEKVNTWENSSEMENEIRLASVNVLQGKESETKQFFYNSEEIRIEMKIESSVTMKHVKVGFDLLKNNEVVFRTQQIDDFKESTIAPGDYIYTCTIPRLLLNEGDYGVRPLFTIHCVRSLTTAEVVVVSFTVKNDTTLSDYHAILTEANHPGKVYPFLNWNVKQQ